MKTLVVYYSVSCGNTARIAKMIAQAIGADIAEIKTVSTYEGSYEDIINQGKTEVEQGYMPPVEPLGVDISDYDRLIIGTPTWWYTYAPAVRTFLNQNDFAGKTVVPFQTHGGWKGHALKDMKSACKGAYVADGYDVRFDSEGGDELITPIKDIEKWIESLKD